jgi:ABC-type branched-subunit amino acid transport system substrate-binding protein
MKKMFFVLILATVVFFGTIHTSLAQEKKEIVVGMTLCLTGRYAVDVGTFDKMVKAWENYVNQKQGGLYVKSYNKKLPVRTIIYDDKSDQATAVKFYERLITIDKCDILIGPKGSPITFPVTAVPEKYQIPIILATANTPAIFGRGFKWMVGVNCLSTAWSDAYFDLLDEEKQVKTIGYLAEDTPHTREVYEGAIPNAEKRGFKTLFQEIAPAGTTDFTSILLKLKAADPDVIYVSSFTPFGVTFRKQTKEFGLKPKEWHFTHFDKSFSGALGKDANCITGEHQWLPGMPYGNLKKFHEILDEAKIDPEEYLDVSLHYGPLEVAEVAIEKADSLKPDDLLKSLKAVNFESIMGPMYFEPTKGHSFFKQIAAQYIDGKYYIISPKKFATHKHIYPNPQP